jgi:ribosomal protection tetracycline resistance protein
MLKRTLNLGILAHVDAGKTTLTERLLFAAGVIDELGRVDDGTTQTDTLALEQQRGITIKSAVVSFAVDGVTVNLIDTPGHPDFIAEVERVLNVLDGAVLVVSAVEGVQAQTRLLMRALQRVRVPTLVFVNKIDRAGADDERVLAAMSERLTPAVVPVGSVRALGTRQADFQAWDGREALAAQTQQALIHPVFFGSALTGAGVDALMGGIAELLPAAEGDADGPVAGTVFKVERGPAGEKLAYVRMFSGTVRTRDRVRFGSGGEAKVTAIGVFDGGAVVRSASVSAGQIGKLSGLVEIQIGDAIGERRAGTEHHFAPPMLETVVAPGDPGDKGRLRVALAQLAEQDPLIEVRQDDARQELSVSLYGEVQKEVVQATLAAEYGLAVTFRETTTICVERPLGVGEAVERIGRQNPFVATLGFRVEPAPAGTGLELRLDVEHGAIPLYVYGNVEAFRDTLAEIAEDALRQGLSGWRVTDCTVTLVDCGYTAPVSTARDFRLLLPLVLMSALKQARTVVCEPLQRFELEAPADTVGRVAAALPQLDAVAESTDTRGSRCVVHGEIPAARLHELQQRIPGLTRGEGVLESAFARYAPVRGVVPTRPRSDNNPLNREEYLLRLARRLGTAG